MTCVRRFEVVSRLPELPLLICHVPTTFVPLFKARLLSRRSAQMGLSAIKLHRIIVSGNKFGLNLTNPLTGLPYLDAHGI